ncbi:tyrosine-type recombinase/integrase [Rufibacter tibetensis]|uniref:Tyr recombinase domain-containing protein n=1 Tax=Rufibacter tibetensis TaxID=512763 RepID=A0A0P0CYX9_9BACT|nr:site-specific integrase [Rufibacter tibetensis]ALJ00682.1 hypothetical protein DC20_18990 [Rufibacter tibetensis]
MNVKIRKRENKNFTKVYVDIYYGFGKREYITVGKLYPPNNNPMVIKANEAVKKQAIEIVTQIKKGNNPYSFHSTSTYTLNSDFTDYFKCIAERKKDSSSQYISSYNHFMKFIGFKKISFQDLNKELVSRFQDYLFDKALSKKKMPLSNNTAVAYFEKLSIVINASIEEEIIAKNPIYSLKLKRKYIQPQRSFLTLDEIKRLENQPLGEHGVLKRAFLFSCYTGFRFGDILKLKRSNIYSIDGSKYACSFKMEKTKEPLVIPLNQKAYNLIKNELSKKPNERIFEGLTYSQSNVIISKWVESAEIYKHITYHNSRHTFACNLIQTNSDIFEVKNLLGHQDIKTTMVYAKTTSERLRSSVERLD